MKSGWRITSNEIITEIINNNKKSDEKSLRKLIREAYPFGERAMHPYKIWCDEVKRLLWIYRKIGTAKRKSIKEGNNKPELF